MYKFQKTSKMKWFRLALTLASVCGPAVVGQINSVPGTSQTECKYRLCSWMVHFCFAISIITLLFPQVEMNEFQERCWYPNTKNIITINNYIEFVGTARNMLG